MIMPVEDKALLNRTITQQGFHLAHGLIAFFFYMAELLKKIDEWRHEQAIQRTQKRRPDLEI